jgi:methyl-accepting chemotaxis protein
MQRFRLRTKILLSVGFIITVVLGTSTIVHIQTMRQDYLEALTWRSEVLAQNIVTQINDRQSLGVTDIQAIFPPLRLLCIKLHEVNKDKNVTHFAVIDPSGIIGAHNDRELWDSSVESPILRDALQHQEQIVVSEDEVYHMLFPVFSTNDTYLATIDIGVSQDVVGQKIQRLIRQSGILFILFLFLAVVMVSFLTYALIAKPVRQLVTLGEQLAAGHLVRIPQRSNRSDEIAILTSAFSRISGYLGNVADVVSHIATGVLDDEIRVRSEQDILGRAVEEMLQYLRHVADVAARVAEGDLTRTVRVRSVTDAFGHAIQTMTQGLRSLIEQIRTSAEQIATTGERISSLSERDIEIVSDIHTSADTMISTMQQMGSSVEEVAHNMTVLSGSVEMTSASVSEMTSSIAILPLIPTS